MRRFMQWMRELIKRYWLKLKHSRFFLFVLGLVIGASAVVIYIYGSALYHDYNQAITIFNRVQAYEVSRDSNDKDTSVIQVAEAKPYNNGDLVSLIQKTFPECSDTMIQIAKAESHFKTDAVNVNKDGTKDCGVFQVNTVHGYDCEWLKNPENNMLAARKVYEKQGFEAWAVYNYAKQHNLPI